MTGTPPGIVLATRSPDKAREIRDILTPILRVPIVTAEERGRLEGVVEPRPGRQDGGDEADEEQR